MVRLKLTTEALQQQHWDRHEINEMVTTNNLFACYNCQIFTVNGQCDEIYIKESHKLIRYIRDFEWVSMLNSIFIHLIDKIRWFWMNVKFDERTILWFCWLNSVKWCSKSKCSNFISIWMTCFQIERQITTELTLSYTMRLNATILFEIQK